MTYGRPVLVSGSEARLLEAVPLQAVDTDKYSEAWLQQLIYRHPESLPVSEIESTFAPLVPICTELATPSDGHIDILFVTPHGRLAVVEVKLWRNPQARREVIGQILEYAKDMSRWNYEGLDAAVRASRRREGHPDTRLGLFDVVKAAVPHLEERRFIDGVSLSMARGDLLLLIVGDGIRQGVSSIAEFLEGHGSLHFTLGIVEMPVFRDGVDRFLLIPRVQAQSLIVRRSVVTSDAARGSALGDESDSPGPEPDVDPALIESRRFFTEFWTELLKGWQLDDQRQPLPNPSRTTNLYLTLPPDGKTWISAYMAKAKSRVGVYLTFERGPLATKLYSELLAQRSEIDKALGVEVDWRSEGQDKYYVIAQQGYRAVGDARGRAEVIDWLRDRLNRFVTVFRPRIEALLRDAVG